MFKSLSFKKKKEELMPNNILQNDSFVHEIIEHYINELDNESKQKRIILNIKRNKKKFGSNKYEINVTNQKKPYHFEAIDNGKSIKVEICTNDSRFNILNINKRTISNNKTLYQIMGYDRNIANITIEVDNDMSRSYTGSFFDESNNIKFFENKKPKYNSSSGMHTLSFSGFVDIPSVKNCVIVDKLTKKTEYIIFGRNANERFTSVFKQPLNTLAAIGLSLCMFQKGS
jgi:hypothetical protein